jgi:hypothetical protein
VPDREWHWVADADPDLFEQVAPGDRERARHDSVAAVVHVPAGEWDAEGQFPDGPGWLGLLVVRGLLVREVHANGQVSAELLGEGDVLRPWDHDGDYAIESITTRFEVLQDATLAELDDAFAMRMAAWPGVLTALAGRLGERSRWLAVRLAFSQIRRVDVRLLMLFWHLAERWGHVTPDGVVIPLQLTHRVLSALLGAERPTITRSLGELEQQGSVQRVGEGGWLLPGDPPSELDSLLAQG